LQTDFLERLLHLIKFERLDDCLNFFHRVSSPGSEMHRVIPGTERMVSRSRAKAVRTQKVTFHQRVLVELARPCEGSQQCFAAKVGELPII
jgi:hypothetical protein